MILMAPNERIERNVRFGSEAADLSAFWAEQRPAHPATSDRVAFQPGAGIEFAIIVIPEGLTRGCLRVHLRRASRTHNTCFTSICVLSYVSVQPD